MSMRNSFIYGYGFNCDCEDEKLIDFIKAHKKTFCKSEIEEKLYDEMLKYTENEYDLEDFFDRYSCESNGMKGNGAVISNIMSRETGIHFMCCQPYGDCYACASIVFEKGYPWQLNDIEKNLTEEKLEEICMIYMEELGILELPDYFSLEYYG